METKRPLFIPLHTRFYEAFVDGSKTVEYRRYGKRWNETTCEIGRPVVISKGYGKQNRLTGFVTGFVQMLIGTEDWCAIYGEPGLAACIEIKLKPME